MQTSWMTLKGGLSPDFVQAWSGFSIIIIIIIAHIYNAPNTSILGAARINMNIVPTTQCRSRYLFVGLLHVLQQEDREMSENVAILAMVLRPKQKKDVLLPFMCHNMGRSVRKLFV